VTFGIQTEAVPADRGETMKVLTGLKAGSSISELVQKTEETIQPGVDFVSTASEQATAFGKGTVEKTQQLWSCVSTTFS